MARTSTIGRPFTIFVQDDRAHYDVVPLGAVFKGIEGVRGFYQAIAALAGRGRLRKFF